MRRPDFFLVGAPKCGTTALYSCLDQHPEIFVPRRKEIHYFGSDLDSPNYLRDTEKYFSLFADARDAKRVGEASVWYLFSKCAAAEIKNFCSDARIIIMLRDPVEMIYSLHSQHLYNGTEDIEDFAEALDAEEDRKRNRRLPQGVPAIQRLFYREVGKYADQVGRYLRAFGPKQVKIIIYDDFKRDSTVLCRETFAFLNVDAAFEPQVRVVNSNKQLRSRTAQLLLNHPPRLLSKIARPLSTQGMRHKVFATLQELNTNHFVRPALASALRSELEEYFAPDVERLSKLLGRSLSEWRRS